MKRRRFFEAVTATLLAVLIVAILATPAMAQGNSGNNKNKDKDGDGGTEEPVAPDLPPIEYHIQFVSGPGETTVTRVYNMNNRGDIVGNYTDVDTGWSQPFYYNKQLNESFDINGLVTNLDDMNGWSIRAALDINNADQIVGAVTNGLQGAPGTSTRGFVLDLLTGIVTLLPDDTFGDFTYGRRINDDGTILGLLREPDLSFRLYIHNVYEPDQVPEVINIPAAHFGEINTPLGESPAQVLGRFDGEGDMVPYFRYTIGEPEAVELLDETLFTNPDLNDQLQGFQFGGINESGTVSGTFTTALVRGKNYYYKHYLVRHGETVLDNLTQMNSWPARGINGAGDIVVGAYELWHDNWGLLDPNVFVTGEAADLEAWFAGGVPRVEHVGSRLDGLDFGQLSGTLDGKGFLLTPVPVE